MRKSWLPRRDAVERALGAIAWRGPDGAVLRDVGDWTLGVARLAISDPKADQPLQCPDTGRWAVLNGAVTSAASQWARYGDRALTRNDAELALHRLRDGGPTALGETSGPYALAVVDPRTDTLWLARDPEGEKPLFVLQQDRRAVAFASSVAALRTLGVDIALPAAEQARLLRYGFHLGSSCNGDGLLLSSDLRGVHEDLPDTGLRPVHTSRVPVPETPLREVVGNAVRRCAGAEVPVALCLSGGVDSGCLAAALASLELAVPAYQFRAHGADPHERDHASLVAAHTGLELRAVEGGPEVLHSLPDLTRHTGLPQGDPSVFAAYTLARAAAADGVRVLLSGEGADELWLGYRRHRAAAWLPPRGIPGGLDRHGLGTGNLSRLLRAATSSTPYDALLQVSPPRFLAEVLQPDALSGTDLPGAGEGEPSLERARSVDRLYYLRCDLLPKLDTATMAAGVEGRCPYLDPEVLATARGPLIRRWLGKQPLKRAFRDDLPARILRQRKRGFGLPLDRWLREDDYLADILSSRETLEREAIDAEGLSRMLDRHRRGAADLGHPLYLVAALETYWRYLENGA